MMWFSRCSPGVGDTAARAAFVIDKNGVVQYSEQTPTPKDLPNFNAVQSSAGQIEVGERNLCPILKHFAPIQAAFVFKV